MHGFANALDRRTASSSLPGALSAPSAMTSPSPDNETPTRRAGRGAAAGYMPISGVLVGAGIGWLVDRAAGHFPLWTVACALLFAGAGVYHMIRDGSR